MLYKKKKCLRWFPYQLIPASISLHPKTCSPFWMEIRQNSKWASTVHESCCEVYGDSHSVTAFLKCLTNWVNSLLIIVAYFAGPERRVSGQQRPAAYPECRGDVLPPAGCLTPKRDATQLSANCIIQKSFQDNLPEQVTQMELYSWLEYSW